MKTCTRTSSYTYQTQTAFQQVLRFMLLYYTNYWVQCHHACCQPTCLSNITLLYISTVPTTSHIQYNNIQMKVLYHMTATFSIFSPKRMVKYQTVWFKTRHLVTLNVRGCPESICPFWISRELVMWPWCNLAASQRRPYCTPVNSHSSVGLVSWQWDAVDWACVLCDRRIHSDRASRSASSRQCACPFYSSRAGFRLAKHHITQVCQPP